MNFERFEVYTFKHYRSFIRPANAYVRLHVTGLLAFQSLGSWESLGFSAALGGNLVCPPYHVGGIYF